MDTLTQILSIYKRFMEGKNTQENVCVLGICEADFLFAGEGWLYVQAVATTIHGHNESRWVTKRVCVLFWPFPPYPDPLGLGRKCPAHASADEYQKVQCMLLTLTADLQPTTTYMFYKTKRGSQVYMFLFLSWRNDHTPALLHPIPRHVLWHFNSNKITEFHLLMSTTTLPPSSMLTAPISCINRKQSFIRRSSPLTFTQKSDAAKECADKSFSQLPMPHDGVTWLWLTHNVYVWCSLIRTYLLKPSEKLQLIIIQLETMPGLQSCEQR